MLVRGAMLLRALDVCPCMRVGAVCLVATSPPALATIVAVGHDTGSGCGFVDDDGHGADGADDCVRNPQPYVCVGGCWQSFAEYVRPSGATASERQQQGAMQG